MKAEEIEQLIEEYLVEGVHLDINNFRTREDLEQLVIDTYNDACWKLLSQLNKKKNNE